jgi:predicted acylesterase/phospholipase RssA
MKAVFTFAFAAANALGPDGKCRVLALRGGGVHGAYEVGVLKAFTEFLDPIDINYDYISGVSIGALNTAVFAMYPPG